MWERFSFYGMRAMLVLFMVDAVRGGMGLTDELATAIYGLYSAGVYLSALPGGWVADRILGARRSVMAGGLIIAAGHFTLAVPSTQAFFLGLVLIVVGTGLLKPNISVLVGELYPEGGARRDAGFTLFYMGINLGAALGPLVCSSLGEKVNWHLGFAAAGVGMILGLLQFWLGGARLGSIGQPHPEMKPLAVAHRRWLVAAVMAGVIVVALGLGGWLRFNPVVLAQWAAAAIVGVAVIFFGSVYALADLNADERKRVHVILILFLSSALFWAGFEQVGSSFNLFTERFTDRTLGSFTVPAGWFQSLGPVFIIVFAPVFASLWVRLAAIGKEPSLAAKFGWGLMLLASGFVVMAGAAAMAFDGSHAAPWWLVATYLLHTFGELCVSPVGLSSVTKLAPPRFVGQMMGAWFLGTSLGNLVAGLIAGRIKMDEARPAPGQFLDMVWLPVCTGVVLLLLGPVIKRWSIGSVRAGNSVR